MRTIKFTSTSGVFVKAIFFILFLMGVNLLGKPFCLAGSRQEVGGIGALLSMEVTQADNSVKTYQYLNDAGGNIVKLLDADTNSVVNSYEYGPFGQVISKTETVENNFQYNTKYLDSETGLLYYGYRFFDSNNGRWINRDPIGYAGGINLYNSVSNNMVNGYSGGLSLSGGMVKELNSNLLKNYHLDIYGHMQITHDLIYIKGMITLTKILDILNRIKINSKKIGIDFKARNIIQLSDGRIKKSGEFSIYNLSKINGETDAINKINVLNSAPELPYFHNLILFTEMNYRYTLTGYTSLTGQKGIVVDIMWVSNIEEISWTVIHEYLAHFHSGYTHFTPSVGKWINWDKSLTGNGGGSVGKTKISNCVKKWIEDYSKKQGRPKPIFDSSHLLGY